MYNYLDTLSSLAPVAHLSATDYEIRFPLTVFLYPVCKTPLILDIQPHTETANSGDYSVSLSSTVLCYVMLKGVK